MIKKQVYSVGFISLLTYERWDRKYCNDPSEARGEKSGQIRIGLWITSTENFRIFKRFPVLNAFSIILIEHTAVVKISLTLQISSTKISATTVVVHGPWTQL